MTKEVENEENDNLVCRLPGDHLDHIGSEQSRSTDLRLPV